MCACLKVLTSIEVAMAEFATFVTGIFVGVGIYIVVFVVWFRPIAR